MIGTVGSIARLTALNRPRDGVRPPPLARLEQSSSLSAPPRTALLDQQRVRRPVRLSVLVALSEEHTTNAIADSTESTQTSMSTTAILIRRFERLRAGIQYSIFALRAPPPTPDQFFFFYHLGSSTPWESRLGVFRRRKLFLTFSRSARAPPWSTAELRAKRDCTRSRQFLLSPTLGSLSLSFSL